MQWLIDIIKDWVIAQAYATMAWVEAKGYTTLTQVLAIAQSVKDWVIAQTYVTMAQVLTVVRGPRFLARREVTTQNVLTGTWTLVELNSVIFDTYSAWLPAFYGFVTPRTGFYQLNYSVGFRPTLSLDKKYIGAIKVNDTFVALAMLHSSHNDYMGSGGSILLALTATDYIELWCFHNSGGSVNLDYTQEMTYLSIHQIP